MIHDGYVFDASINGMAFSYRPMLSHERRAFLTSFTTFHKLHRDGLRCEWLERHLVASDFGSMRSLYRDSPISFRTVALMLQGLLNQSDPHWEWNSANNLRTGVALHFTYPGLSRRSCARCQAFWFGDESDKPLQFNGKPIPRTVDTPVPCSIPGVTCPVGTPAKQRRLDPRNRMAFEHFQLCDAVGHFPDDPIVARNARIIREVIRGLRTRQSRRLVGGKRSAMDRAG